MRITKLKHLHRQTAKVENRLDTILDSLSGSMRDKLPPGMFVELNSLRDAVSKFNDSIDAAIQEAKAVGISKEAVL